MNTNSNRYFIKSGAEEQEVDVGEYLRRAEVNGASYFKGGPRSFSVIKGGVVAVEGIVVDTQKVAEAALQGNS